MYINVYIFGMEMGQKNHFSYQISQEKNPLSCENGNKINFSVRQFFDRLQKKKKKKKKNLKMIKLLEN